MVYKSTTTLGSCKRKANFSGSMLSEPKRKVLKCHAEGIKHSTLLDLHLLGNGYECEQVVRGRTENSVSSNLCSPSKTAILWKDLVEIKQPISGAITKTDYLHTACRLFPKDIEVINSALFLQPATICRRAINAEQSPMNDIMRTSVMRDEKQYSLPINIALKHRASMDVVKLLVAADPSVLLLKDGQDDCASLSIALRSFQQFQGDLLEVVKVLLRLAPNCAKVHDRKLNYPLHVACYTGASLAVVRCLYNQYPKAILQKNFNNESPLTIAQNNVRCSEDALDFLQHCVFGDSKHPEIETL